MSRTPDILSKRCQGLYQGAGQAIGWVAEVRPGAQRLDRDADGLIERLRRSRNLARRLGQAAKRPMSAGFFGLSQAGKSYLISSLARGDGGRLETVLDGERLDFIDHINPPGGGKEATGLVTRFTRKPPVTTPGYPVLLSLLNEADMVKILGNSFFLDFDRERANFDIPQETILARLKELQGRRQAKPTGGMDEDDVVDLADYFDRRFKSRTNRWLACSGPPPSVWPPICWPPTAPACSPWYGANCRNSPTPMPSCGSFCKACPSPPKCMRRPRPWWNKAAGSIPKAIPS